MKSKKTIIICVCVTLVAAILVGIIGGAVTKKAADPEKETIVQEAVDSDAMYRFTYERVGGTDENPIYQLVIEVLGDEPLIIEGGSVLGG